MMHKLAAILLLLLLLPAGARGAITEVCAFGNPADNGSYLDNANAGTVTLDINGNCTLQNGDFIVVEVGQRVNDPTFTNTTSGGLTWSSLTAQSQGGSSHAQTWYATYTGTYTADPIFTTSSTGGQAFSAIVTVFRPTVTGSTWAVDVNQQISNTTPTTPFDVTINGQTAVASSTLTLGMWMTTTATAMTWSLQTAGWNNPGANPQFRNTGATDFSISLAYKINTAAGATGNVANRQTSSTGTITVMSIVTFKETAPAGPSFTATPAIGTRTTSSIPITFTSDTDGTVYGARLTDGSAAPTCDQLEAQTATGGVQYFSEAVVATVADTETFGSITDGTVTDGYFCIEDGSANDSAVASIANMYKLPAFTAGPTYSTCSATGCTYSLTLDGPGTVYGVACKEGSAAATVTQVEAGNCTGNVAAVAAANKAVTGADTLTIGSALDFPAHDFAIVGVYGSQHEAAIHADNNRLKSAPAGYLYDVLSSVGTGSFCEDIASPSVAASDIVERYSTTSPGAFSAPALNDCHISYAGDDSRQLFCYRIYDDSAQDWMSVDSPSPQCTGTRAALWFNNQDPFPLFAAGSIRIIGTEGVPLEALDMRIFCSDPDDEPEDIVVTALDALPSGLSVTNSELSGTPAARGATTDITFRCTDITGASVDWD